MKSSSSKESSTGVPLQYLKGVGPKRAAALHEAGISAVRDLLNYYPFGYLDRSTVVRIGDLRNHVDTGKPVTVIGEVYRQEGRRSKRTRKLITFLTVRDENDYLTCVWFERAEWYKDAFEPGELLALAAKPTYDQMGRIQFVHPEFDRLKGAPEEDEPDWGRLFNTGSIIPKYSSSAQLAKAGLDSRGFRRILRQAVDRHADTIAETLSPKIVDQHDLLELRRAVREIHFPEDHTLLEHARRRLKFDELFYLQLMLAYRRKINREESKGISYELESSLARTLISALPFELTSAQQKVLREIADDMKSPRPMNRLLQGDVGSGKTIVALLSALVAADNGYQVAFMAPTEILAEQHYRSILQFVAPLPIEVRLLVGGQRKKARAEILEDIREGRAHIVVGTHALIEEGVKFRELGFVIIDEQHRFGVLQRNELRAKGLHPDVLVMTATPIPRTLSMTLYGDLDVSIIDELPAHRKPIRTAIRLDHQKERVYQFVRDEVAAGRQAYIVVPLIEESEKIDLKAATKEFDRLQKEVFPNLRLGLLHGRLSSADKEDVMRSFKEKDLDVLVATTVIEVGIDIPNASVMIIEDAERFGLSQLHQLRGRVGRGADQSYCILMADYGYFQRKKGVSADEAREEQDKARRRLETMVETTDGFKIAEVDLQLRGPGELFGTRQSGLPELRVANLQTDQDVLRDARAAAFHLVADDPELRSKENAMIRTHFTQHHKDQIALSSVG
ncbi:MAG: ATP-dependent DNA helicase RecG [Ignavibacteria bacterium]|nr:ATP-dependent DNA helicase RecG [Ignavibacteria bacterium]